MDIFEWSLDEVLKKRNQVIWPNSLAFIKILPETAKERARLARMATPKFLFDDQFNREIESAFKIFSDRGLASIEYIEGENDRDVVYQDFLAYLAIQTSLASLSSAGISPT